MGAFSMMAITTIMTITIIPILSIMTIATSTVLGACSDECEFGLAWQGQGVPGTEATFTLMLSSTSTKYFKPRCKDNPLAPINGLHLIYLTKLVAVGHVFLTGAPQPKHLNMPLFLNSISLAWVHVSNIEEWQRSSGTLSKDKLELLKSPTWSFAWQTGAEEFFEPRLTPIPSRFDIPRVLHYMNT